MRRGWLVVPLVAAALFAPVRARAEEKTLETRYSVIRYSQDSQLNDFLWRITGNRLASGQPADDPVKARVDELVDRVEGLLDMYPASLHFEIEVTEAAGAHGPPAHYENDEKRIYASPATVTDGMLAHEIAHAVICAQFPVPPPEKAQEILARYVDQNLWGEA